jgi:hypothetical protein
MLNGRKLNIDDLELLKFIQRKLNCGHISISGSKCNYFVNDQASLIHVISPIFNHVQLNSTKYFDFLTFDKAVNLVKNKEHLSPKGKLKIIEYYHEMKNEKASNSTPSGGPQGPRRQGDIHISSRPVYLPPRGACRSPLRSKPSGTDY